MFGRDSLRAEVHYSFNRVHQEAIWKRSLRNQFELELLHFQVPEI